ncbi:MAG: DUF1761 domain-containing protein [Xanthobacteraceae bacterium]|nr:DUF1761 domain-containing protein [Xanthobacteraceae bacterium]
MTFAGINYIAILIAAVAGWVAGAIWYMVLAKPWMAAVGLTREEIEASRQQPGGSLPFVYAFAANVIMAWVLAGLIGHLGTVTIRGGAISGALCWLGFVMTTMLVNYSFGMRSRMLLLIDGAHWLVVLALMGAIIGGIGV